MRQIPVLVLLLTLASGCFTASDRQQWNEAMKDMNGDNMKMRSRGDAKAVADELPLLKPKG